MTQSPAPLLSVQHLSIRIGQQAQPVHNVSFSVQPGELIALVGESGSGKSLTAAAITQLLPPGSVCQGQILWKGETLLQASPQRLMQLRGTEVGMVFQEPLAAFNPLHTTGRQIAERIVLHQGMNQKAALAHVLTLLDQVGLSSSLLTRYPHELSGGQRQRIMIAMALANHPQLLIADEPTTALDVTLQQQILQLIRSLQRQLNLAVLLITHDLALVRHFADCAVVMHNGYSVETRRITELFAVNPPPLHPYTHTLLAAEPEGHPVDLPDPHPLLLQLHQFQVAFPVRRGVFKRIHHYVQAVQPLEISLHTGETLGIVGESGSGKTSLGLAILRLIASEGDLFYLNQNLNRLNRRQLRPWRQQIQMVFQDPYGSLSPRMSVAQILAEGLTVHGISKKEQEERILTAMKDVHLDPDFQHRYPHEFSGGQRQRIALARALVLRPQLLVLDEPTSALDRTVQKQMVNLLRRLQATYQFSMIFISHDLKVVRALSHQVLVLRQGEVVEQGSAEAIFTRPQSEYTRLLLDAARLDPLDNAVTPPDRPG